MEVSLDEPLNVDSEGNELLLGDILGTDNDLVYNDIEVSVEKELLNLSLNKLSKREQQIVNLRFGLNGAEEKNAKRGRGFAWHFPILHIPSGKENHN